MRHIGKRVEEVLAELEIGFNEFDRIIGVTEGYTSGLVNPRKDMSPRQPRSETLKTIAEKLAVNTDWLLEERGPKYRVETSAPLEARWRWIEKTPDYPNLALALEMGAREGIPDWFLEEFREQRMKSRVDSPPQIWLNEAREEYPKRLRERTDPKFAAEQKVKREKDLESAEERTRPKLPWSKAVEPAPIPKKKKKP